MSHTPGPWRYEQATKTIRSVPANYWLATMDSWDGAVNNEANAKLIAAAPKMLAALESLFKECAMIHSRYGEFCNQKEADAAIKAGLDAIAEAKGE